MPLMAIDQFAVVGLLDIIAADPFEHVAEQIELAIGVRRRGTRARPHQHGARLGHEKRQRRACGALRKITESCASSTTFSPSFAAHHGPGSMGVPSYELDYRNTGRVAFAASTDAIWDVDPMIATGSPVS